MKVSLILLSFFLFSAVLAQHTYFGTYGTSDDSCCPKRVAETNPNVNWDKNFILNGDFEDPKLPSGKDHYSYSGIPHWKTNGKFQLLTGYHGQDMTTQALELDPDANGYAFRQQMTLYQGKFELKFNYAARTGHPAEESSFYVYFNGVEILKIRPDLHGLTTIVMTVNGRDGPNVLEFVDNGKIKYPGAAVDNVGIYAWKTNKFCQVQEIEAVGAGYPIEFSSVLN